MTQFEAFLDGFNYLTLERKIDIYNSYAILRGKEKIYINSETELENLFSQYSRLEMLQVYKYSSINEDGKWLFRRSYYVWETLDSKAAQQIIRDCAKEIFECKSCWSRYLDYEAIKTKARNSSQQEDEFNTNIDELAIARACFERDFKQQ